MANLSLNYLANCSQPPAVPLASRNDSRAINSRLTRLGYILYCSNPKIYRRQSKRTGGPSSEGRDETRSPVQQGLCDLLLSITSIVKAGGNRIVGDAHHCMTSELQIVIMLPLTRCLALNEERSIGCEVYMYAEALWPY